SEASTSTLPQIEMADSISQDTDKQKKHLATMNISTRAIEPSTAILYSMDNKVN
ncbi:10329_t:CDS:2, partial [Entrophospora sp. SA101]